MRAYILILLVSVMSGCATIDIGLDAAEINNINFLSTAFYK